MRIAIFGTTGAGKTTLIENLKTLLPESYNCVWETSLDCPYFDQAYNDENPDVQTLNYKLDLWMLTDRMKTFKKYASNNDVIYDRSLLDSMVFAQTDHSYGRLSDADYLTFKEYFMACILPNAFGEDLHHPKFDVAIYLRVSPDKAIERIGKRGRGMELDTNDMFWYDLAKAYDMWYEIYKEIVPFWVVDGNNDDPMSYASSLANKIMEFDNKKRTK